VLELRQKKASIEAAIRGKSPVPVGKTGGLAKLPEPALYTRAMNYAQSLMAEILHRADSNFPCRALIEMSVLREMAKKCSAEKLVSQGIDAESMIADVLAFLDESKYLEQVANHGGDLKDAASAPGIFVRLLPRGVSLMRQTVLGQATPMPFRSFLNRHGDFSAEQAGMAIEDAIVGAQQAWERSSL
jgi:hypothetical protein